MVEIDTSLSHVDGAQGQLLIHGHALDQLVDWSFERVVAMLVAAGSGNPKEITESAEQMEAGRHEVFAQLSGSLDRLGPEIVTRSPYDVLRILIAHLDDGSTVKTGIKTIAAFGVLLPAALRLQKGLRPIAPVAGHSHAEDLLYMLSGESPSPAEISALNTYLVTVSDHGMNASTLTARVVASTGAGLVSSVLAGMSALKGPLHGGAPGPIIDMLDEISHPDKAEKWMVRQLEAGERIMGFGHRIYRVRDPRADALKNALKKLTSGDSNRLMLAEAVERAALKALAYAKPHRKLETNVEFFTAVLLERLGFASDAFTGVFASGRSAGWIAHATEQQRNGRLIRPESRYTGPQQPSQ